MPSILTDYECKSSGDRKINLVRVKGYDMNPDIELRTAMWLDKVTGRMLDDFGTVIGAISSKTLADLIPTAMFIMPSGSLVAYVERKWHGCIWTMQCHWDRALDIPEIREQNNHPASMRCGKLILPTASPFSAEALRPSDNETLMRSHIHRYNELVIDTRKVLGFLRVPTA